MKIMRPADALRLARVVERSGLWRPRRPDRWLGVALAIHRFGPGLAGIISSASSLHGRDIALIDHERHLTFTELDARSNALAHALANRGVTTGSVTAILARNRVGFVEAIAGVAKTGAHMLLLNTQMAGPQLHDICAREGVATILVDDDLAHLAESVPDVEHISMSSIDALVADHTSAAPRVPVAPGRTIILTSGTTGTPKGANRDTPSVAAAATIGLLDLIAYRGSRPMLVAAPLFHAWGFANLTISLALGGTTVLQPRFDPEATLDAIATHRVDTLVAVPVMLRRMLELDPSVRARYDTSTLRVVPLSGSSLPWGLAEAFMDAFGDVVYNLYGSTEVGSVTVATPADLRAAPGTAGHPTPGITLRIIDDDDKSVGVGVRGRIMVHSPLTFGGYTDGTNKAVVDGYMATGDVGHLDEHGRLFVEGRDDDMIVSGGENVFPLEVEDLLATHPAIMEAAVTAVPDPEFGARLHAHVVRAHGAEVDADEVRTFVRDRLARYKVPRDVTFVDVLPRNATGKIVKRALTP